MTTAEIIKRLFGSTWEFVRGFSGGTSVNSDGHHGWDIKTALGSTVPSLADGTVVYAEFAGGGGPGFVNSYKPPDDESKASRFWATGGGNVVIVEAADGTRYQYAHLSEFGVKVGDHVGFGSPIGKVGSTGDATGPHLHFAMYATQLVHGTRIGKEWVDPSSFLSSLAGQNLLPGFGFLVSFPIGHKLTEDDVNHIIDTVNAAGWFQGTNIFGEVKARNAFADTLKTFIGREWSPELLAEIAAAEGIKATTVDANPLTGIAETFSALLNPMTYVHTAALLLGLYLAYKGFQWTAQAGGATTETVG